MIHRSPLLFWVLYFLLGCGFALFPHWAYLIPLSCLLLYFQARRCGLVFLILGWVFTSYQTPFYKQEPLEGKGLFTLRAICPAQSPFARSMALKGTFKTFESSGSYCYNLPCVIFQKAIPKSGEKWILEGTLQRGVFKPKKQTPWIELPSSFNLIRWRFAHKESLRKFFSEKVKNPKVAYFFSSMATGDVNDRLLSLEFQKLGLAHILAISGFHFALIAGMLGVILNQIFPYRMANSLLLLALTLYFLFLGQSPSILRAFIMITFYIIGKLWHRRPDVLNLLGLSLFIELLINPRVVTLIGFQFSFLATLGILLFHTHFHRFFMRAFPKRSFATLLKWPLLDQHAYLFTTSLRNAFALSGAVTCTTLPLQLFLFHTFSFISLPYNLVFSPFIAFSLLLIPFSLILPPIRHLNEAFTGWLLNLLSSPPEILNFKLYIPPFSFSLLMALISLTLLIGLTKRGAPS